MADQEGGVAAVQRALTILSVFRVEDDGLTLNELAERTKLYKSTILRILTTLVQNAYVIRTESGRYRLGHALLHLGSVYQHSFRLEAHVPPILRQLAGDTGESATFYVRDGDERICLFRVESTQTVRDHHQVGDVLPLSRGASGRVLRVFAGGSQLATPADLAALPFVQVDKHAPDVTSVAYPIFGSTGKLLGALSASGPAARFTAALETRVSAAVVQAAKRLTQELGGNFAVQPREAMTR